MRTLLFCQVWIALLLCFALSGVCTVQAQAANLGRFTGNSDIGNVAKVGRVEYDAKADLYRITGGGENMWFTNDACHFVWKRVEAGVALAADIRWPITGGNAHRKACLILRQSLDADSAYADAVLHGDGLTSLQYREARGAPTREIQSNVSGPARLQIEKRGDYVSMSVAPAGEPLRPAGGSFRIGFKSPFYVGLAVCAHNNKVVETAEFSNVSITTLPPLDPAKARVASTLEVVNIASTDRRVVYHTRDLIEAPNWMPDGQHLLFNGGGRIYTLPLKGGQPQLLDTGFAIRCNNDHGISPDGTRLVISDQTEDGKSRIYTLPITGGTPQKITPLAPSYWHGWSPDGRTLVYCAERNGQYDVYTIPANGGEERRLTTAAGLDDGPEYSPDGKFIYFNSDRTGLMQIWRMKPDGADQEPVTRDDFNNWFAHPSPDGKWLVLLTYAKEVKGHPANQDVMLRLMSPDGGEPRVLAKLFGGQGTINVPSWSPDSRQVAFVSYQLVEP